MRLPTILLTLLAEIIVASIPAGADDTTSDLVCQVLRQPRHYLGQTFSFKGTFYHGVHSTYFMPEQKCGSNMAIQAIGFVSPATRGRSSALVVAKGRIAIHRQTPEPEIGKPAETIAFLVISVARVPVESQSN